MQVILVLVAFTALIWGWGMVSMRKRGSPWKAKLLFTVACWAGVLLFVLPNRISQIVFETRTGQIIEVIAIIGLTSIAFLTKRKYLAFLCFCAELLMVGFSFFADILFFYPLFGAGVLLVLGSLFMAFVGKPRRRGSF